MTIDAALRDIASTPGPVALITVAEVEGSAPRHVGARMALRPDGHAIGTVGGGALEARARDAALACLASGRSSVIRVEMSGESATAAELICGGASLLWIEVVSDSSHYAAALAAVDGGEAVVLVASADKGCLAVVGPGSAAKLRAGLSPDKVALDLARGSGRCVLGEADGLLYSPLEPAERLLILGGGHVGQALARAAASISFLITVADPRPEFSRAERFPAEVERLNMGFIEAIELFPSGLSSYVVVVSPGHLGDLECARALLAREYRYVGLIGSRRKSRMLIEELITEGFPRAKVDALRMPIGLDIGAETPEEIAVSIMAELVAVRRKSAALGTFDADRKRRLDNSRSG